MPLTGVLVPPCVFPVKDDEATDVTGVVADPNEPDVLEPGEIEVDNGLFPVDSLKSTTVVVTEVLTEPDGVYGGRFAVTSV